MREAKSDGIESEYLALKLDKNFFRDESNTHKKNYGTESTSFSKVLDCIANTWEGQGIQEETE